MFMIRYLNSKVSTGGREGGSLAQSVECRTVDIRVYGSVPGVYAASFIPKKDNSHPISHSTLV